MNEPRTNEQDAVSYQQGDKQALSRLWERNRGFISGRCFQFYNNHLSQCAAHGAELDDLYQEAFLALVDAVKAFDPERGYKFLTWLSFPMKNRFAILLGWRGGAAPRPLDNCKSLDELVGEEKQTPLGELIPDPQAEREFQGVEEQIYNQQLHDALEAAMSVLPEQRRNVLHWRYYEGLTLQQIADKLHSDKSHPRQLQAKALRDLRSSRNLRKLYSFLHETSLAYIGTGFQAWKCRGSVEERLLERAERS